MLELRPAPTGNRQSTMSARPLLTISAVIELGAGVAIATVPSAAASLLFGASLDAPVAEVVARVAGIALLSLGIACWLARPDEQSRTAIGLITAMLFYNADVATLLAIAGMAINLSGPALWPAAFLHVAMAIWCFAFLLIRRRAASH
jgi:hypothetical protein